MKKREILELSQEELKLRLEDGELELSNMLFQQSTHQIDNPLQIRETRRGIARIKTILREYELGIRKSGETQE